MRFLPVLAAVLLCSCVHHQPGSVVDPRSGVAYSQFVSIAGIDADPQLASRLTEMFQKAGITAIIEGSVVYGVSVAPSQRVHAVTLLRQDAEVHEYWIQFSSHE